MKTIGCLIRLAILLAILAAVLCAPAIMMIGAALLGY
jgi:hypothetical protein